MHENEREAYGFILKTGNCNTQELYQFSGEGRYLFPSIRTDSRPMSENTINSILCRLGYSKEEMTVHGFCSMALKLLNEQGWNRDTIERQLA